MLVRGLWGMQIGPEADQAFRVAASFKITMASIYKINGPHKRTSVYITFQCSTFLLCSLIPEKVEQQVLDLTCLQGEDITFRVEGPNVIHLLGNYISQKGIDDLNDEEVEYVEIEGSAKHDLYDEQSSVGFSQSEKISFDESDEFGSLSESQSQSEVEIESATETETDTEAEGPESESESESELEDYSHLTGYVTESSSTRSAPFGDEDVDYQNPVITMEGKGKYVLLSNNISDDDTIPAFAKQSLKPEAVVQPAASEVIYPLEPKIVIDSCALGPASPEQTTEKDVKKSTKTAKKQKKKLASRSQQQQSGTLVSEDLSNPPTEDSEQIIKGLVLGAFADMTSTLQGFATAQPISRYPIRVGRIDSMEKLALLAQEDAKSAMDTRNERTKKKLLQRTDEVITKKARLSAASNKN